MIVEIKIVSNLEFRSEPEPDKWNLRLNRIRTGKNSQISERTASTIVFKSRRSRDSCLKDWMAHSKLQFQRLIVHINGYDEIWLKMLVWHQLGDKISMLTTYFIILVIFNVFDRSPTYKIGYHHPKVVTNESRLRHPSPTSTYQTVIWNSLFLWFNFYLDPL